MTRVLGSSVVILALVAANVVAAGVVLVLGMVWKSIAPGIDSVLPWFVICGAGAFAAYIFVRGAMVFSRQLVEGLQWRSSRRGG